MTIRQGSRIGPYEVISSLGEGAMGVVFRARDLQLRRDVALKMLPKDFATDPDRLSRFQREAQVLASLNHPNIAQIYGLEGRDESRCIVMELVDGETLRERLRRGALPVEDALRLAIQIADALEAAHEKGIVHRDLKPANIKITAEGKIKVLDFGLALTAVDASDGASLADSPTLMSSPGLIMGTPAYMSPDQARGRTVDKRSDIFSFGCVLYEMLTARPAFDGENVADTVSRVLQRDPDWSTLPSNLSPAIFQVLRCCLEKDVKKRRRDIGDVRIDLEHAFSEPAPAALSPARSGGPRLAWILLAMSALLVLALSVSAILHLRERPVELAEMRVDITTPQTPQPLHFALSPDGTRLVFVASGTGPQQLWLRALGAGAAQPLAGTGGAEYPFWSPDSRSIGFFAAGKTKRIDIGDDAPRILADAPAGRGGAWSSDGTILFVATTAGPLWRVPASGGTPIQVTKLDLPRQSSGHRLPQFLPDGRRFLFFAQGSPEVQGTYLTSLDGGEAKRLAAGDTAGVFMEPGLIVLNNQGALVARHLDITRGALMGEAIPLAESVAYDSIFNLAGFSASATGSIAYRKAGMERRQLTWFDRAGRRVGVAGEIDSTIFGVDISPDDRQVAVTQMVQNNPDVWLIDALRGGATRLTSDPGIDQFGTWSPDGTEIAFTSNRSGIYEPFAKASSGAGDEKLLLKSSHAKAPTDWSRDGRFILTQDSDPKSGWNVWALPMSRATGERKPIPVVTTAFEERAGQFSPDGKWIAYQSNETGQFEIYVQPFPGPGGKTKVSTAGGRDPRWRADGKELFFIGPNSRLMTVPIQASGSKLEPGSPTMLFQTRIVSGGLASLKPQYAVSRDGRFLINIALEESAATPITLILNWNPKRN